MNICLVRHGVTDWVVAQKLQGREDIPLNADGIRDAREIADALAQFEWSVVVSSPLSRTRDTAEIIAKALGLGDVVIEPDFIERDYGKASGLTPEARKARYPDGQYEGLEPFESLQARIFSALMRTVERYPNENIVVVAHGGAINSALSKVTGGAIGTGKTRLTPGCLNMLAYEDGEWRVVFCNKMPDEIIRTP